MDKPVPKLLKIRQFHSRVFLILAVVLLIIAKPKLAGGEFPRECMLWIGYFLVIFGTMGRAYCSLYIGGRKNESIIMDGPYSVVRNPLYLFSFIAILGVGLQSGMVTVIALLGTAFIAYYPLVVAREEAFLHHKFGGAYLAYMHEVPRWIPDFKRWTEPQHIEAQPKYVRRTLMDAAVFFLPLPGLAIIYSLHDSGIVPVWLTLP